jgi:hypothetical protein
MRLLQQPEILDKPSARRRAIWSVSLSARSPVGEFAGSSIATHLKYFSGSLRWGTWANILWMKLVVILQLTRSDMFAQPPLAAIDQTLGR